MAVIGSTACSTAQINTARVGSHAGRGQVLLGLGQLLGNLDKGLTHMIPSTRTGLGKEQVGLFGIRLTLLKGDLPLGLQIELVADQRNHNVG